MSTIGCQWWALRGFHMDLPSEDALIDYWSWKYEPIEDEL